MAEPEDSPQEPTPPSPKGPDYKVGQPRSSQAEAPEAAGRQVRPKKKSAVFVAHGMGQQIPFQTLNDVAAGLLAQSADWSEPKARLIEVPGLDGAPAERLQRIELIHTDARGDERHVHVYEAYWAPLTEGRVTLRDVISFLFSTGLSGLQKGQRTFQRWLIGEPRDFELPIRVVLYLVVALLVVASLVSMNSVVVLVSAARIPLQTSTARWLSAHLFADLSTTLNLYLVPVIFFVLCLILAALERKRRGRRRGGALLHVVQWLGLLGFVAVLFATVLAAVAMIVLLYRHIQLSNMGQDQEIWKKVLGDSSLTTFNNVFEKGLLLVLGLAIGGLVLSWIARTAWLGIRDLTSKKGMDRIATLVAGALTLLLAAAAVGLIYYLASAETMHALFATTGNEYLRTLQRGISWPVLIAVSYFVRGVLVQYVGDVAVYVTSYRLDRFQELRLEIRDLVFKAARAVYANTEDGTGYDEVVVVGHSLGSAVVYDAVNRLVNEDILAQRRGAPTLEVVTRTPLLLTFGSPLDKFAFLFALQSDSPGRQAVAATLQPLIQDYAFRPRWINIYSPWDIISGDLDFYDPPGATPETHPRRVINKADPQASTLLAAHVEYWENELLLNTLFLQVTS